MLNSEAFQTTAGTSRQTQMTCSVKAFSAMIYRFFAILSACDGNNRLNNNTIFDRPGRIS